MIVAEIELYKILKTKFTENEAEAIVGSIGQQVHGSFEERKNDFATKEDIAKLEGGMKERIAKLNADLQEKIAKGDADLQEKIAKGDADLQERIAKAEGRLEARIAESKADIIKWNFIFWIGQMASFIAIAKFFFHQ